MAAEIPDGAVLIARAILNSSLWTMRAEDCKVAMTCIALANWRDQKWFDGEKEILIKRGQFVRSRDDFANSCGLSLQKTRTAVKHLENSGFLTRFPTSRYTLYTVPKYDFYQTLANYSDSANPVPNPQLTRSQPAPNPDLTRAQPEPNHKQERQEGEEGEEGQEEEKSAELAKTPASVPTALKGLALYEQDRNLCSRWATLYPQWAQAYPGVDIELEVKRAHAWEIANPKKRKVDRPRFLNNWLSHQQDSPRRASGSDEKPLSVMLTEWAAKEDRSTGT